MTGHLDTGRFEELALGAAALAGEEAHLAQCAACAQELAWARAERALLSRRPVPSVEHLWAGVQERISRPSRRARGPHRERRIAVGAAAAAALAASLVFALRTGPKPTADVPQPVAQAPLGPQPGTGPEAKAPEATSSGPDARTLLALDRAEADYRDAAKVLEAEYARIRPSLDPKLAARWDETLSRARIHLGDAQKELVALDVNARMRVLDGYAAYVRTLRTALVSQEANP